MAEHAEKVTSRQEPHESLKVAGHQNVHGRAHRLLAVFGLAVLVLGGALLIPTRHPEPVQDVVPAARG